MYHPGSLPITNVIAKASTQTVGFYPDQTPEFLRQTSRFIKHFQLERSNFGSPYFIHRFQNITDSGYFHIDASFDHIRETGFWDDGAEIQSEWWYINSDYGTNYSAPDSASTIPDQVIV